MNFFGLPLDAGIIIFPLSYILGDMLTDVYGFKESRRVIWTGFALLLFSTLTIYLATVAPPAPGWHGQQAFEQAFGLVPRISLASLIAYLFGELTNGWVLELLKKRAPHNRHFIRFIGSTIVGEAVDTTLFLCIAFGGVWPLQQLLVVGTLNYVFKVSFEVPFLPITYHLSTWLRKKEGISG